MRLAYLLLPALLLAAPVAEAQRGAAVERRCGWLANPTPGNYWLNDRHGEWTLSEQGGYRARGMDRMPDMSTRGWVRTNGNYGYGCACMNVRVNARTRRVVELRSATPVPLAQCHRDRALQRPD